MRSEGFFKRVDEKVGPNPLGCRSIGLLKPKYEKLFLKFIDKKILPPIFNIFT